MYHDYKYLADRASYHVKGWIGALLAICVLICALAIEAIGE